MNMSYNVAILKHKLQLYIFQLDALNITPVKQVYRAMHSRGRHHPLYQVNNNNNNYQHVLSSVGM